jgi:hypothetical protein
MKISGKYARAVIYVLYPLLVLEYQIREVCRSYRNWKPSHAYRMSKHIKQDWLKANADR